MFLYRACAGEYSDDKIAEKGSQDAVKGDAGQDQAPPPAEGGSDVKPSAITAVDGTSDSGNYDTITGRASLLTSRLIKIGTKVPIFDIPGPDETEDSEATPLMKKEEDSKKDKKKDKKNFKRVKLFDLHVAVDALKQLEGVKEHADHNLEDWDSEIKFGTLSGEDYANYRLNGQLQLLEEEADKLDWRLLYYKVATYAIGAVGGFLSFLSLEVIFERSVYFRASN
jgi:hypothetical protein